MPHQERILGAVQQIYAAATDTGQWSDSLSAIIAPMEASRAFFVSQDLLSGDVAISTDRNSETDHIVRYSSAAAAGFVPAWRRTIQQGAVVRSSQMQDDTASMRTPFYNEVLRPAGDFFGLVAQIAHNHCSDTFLCVHKPKGAADFTDTDVATLQHLMPHLATALELRTRIANLEAQERDIRVALDKLDEGFVLLNSSAEPVFSNRIGETMMTAEPRLAAALAGLRGRVPRNGGSFEVARDAKRPLHVQLTPIGEGKKLTRLSDRATSVMMVTDPEVVDRRRIGALIKSYGLTPAEARLAMEICKGDGRASAASRLGISPATARAHLSRIFEKTGLHRQAELVRLLMTSRH